METSVFLAKVLGLFGVISTIAIIFTYKEHLRLERESAENPASLYVSGYIFLLIGILIVVSHNIWSSDWRLIITILGWMILLKGSLRIISPESVKTLINKKRDNFKYIIPEIIILIISSYLLYQGFAH